MVRSKLGLITFSALATLLLAATPDRATAQVMDDLNGLWKVTLDGKEQKGDGLSESYHGIRIRILPDGKPVDLKRNGDTLTSIEGSGSSTTPGVVGALDGDDGSSSTTGAEPKVKLRISGLDTPAKDDDKLTGMWFGKKAVFTRDIAVKPPIEIDMADGDRPWVRFMREVLIPKSAEDRESYHRFDKKRGGEWIMGTELGAKGYWINKGWIKNQATFDKLFQDYHNTLNTPRNVLSTKLNGLVTDAMRPDKKSEAGLALSQLGMYFSTASGGSVRLLVTSNKDSVVYYITDKRAHERTGLVVNKTPTHRPLASSFGKWQNDAGEMRLADDEPYDRAVLELMTKSNTSSMNAVSGTGRGAFTDYFGIMAIEDQRGVMFGNDDLDWGRNMTEASFIISIIRSLGHGEFRKKPKYQPAPEKSVKNEPLSGLTARANGMLAPQRGIKPKTIRIEAPGLTDVVDDGEGTLHVVGTDPKKESVGYVDYSDGSLDISWNGFAKEAEISWKDLDNNSKSRKLSLTTSVSNQLAPAKVQPKSVKVKAGGFKEIFDDGDGNLYEEGKNPQTDESIGWMDYDDGSIEITWPGVPTGALTATYKTTDGKSHTQTLKATSSASGLVDPLGVTPKSVRITSAGGPAIVDDGEGSLIEDGDKTKNRGYVDYASGSYNVRWVGVPAQPIKVTFKAGNQTQTLAAPEITVSASGSTKSKKVTPKSVLIEANGLPDVIDDGKGTLYDKGSTPDKASRGYIDYAEGSFSVSWKGIPKGPVTIDYKTKAGEIVLTNEKELAMQVIVDGEDGPELRPGTPSYIDIMNGAENALEGGFQGGGDCQVGDMYLLEELTTKWLRAEHKAVIDRLEKDLAAFGYEKGNDNLFSAMTYVFYDNEKFSKVTPSQADEIVEAGLEMFRTIRKNSKKLEKFILANGVKKSEEWAPRASGF